MSYRQEAVSRCYEDEPLALVRDIGNAHDRNAIKIFAGSDHIGFVPKGTNRGFAEYMDSGGVLEAEIEAIVGGESEKPNKGVVARLYIFLPMWTSSLMMLSVETEEAIYRKRSLPGCVG